jgi:hypothetical protein
VTEDLKPPPASGWHRALRLAALGGFMLGIAVLVARSGKNPVEEDLRHYVEIEVPALKRLEAPIDAQIARLDESPGLKPEEARRLLVEDSIPSLLRLKKATESVPTRTPITRALNRSYQSTTDALIEACRRAVQAIDDPNLSGPDGLKRVRAGFAEVRARTAAWQAEVHEACEHQGLAR